MGHLENDLISFFKMEVLANASLNQPAEVVNASIISREDLLDQFLVELGTTIQTEPKWKVNYCHM